MCSSDLIKRGGWKNWTAYVLVTTVGFFSHYFAISVFFAGLVIYWLLRDDQKRRLSPWMVSQAILAMTLATSLVIGRITASGMVSFSLPTIKSLIKSIGTAPFVFLEGYVRHSIGSGSAALGLSHWQQLGLVLSLVITVGVLILFKTFRKRFLTRNMVAVALYTFMLVAIPVSLQLLRGGSIAGRYYSMAAPTFIILIAVLISTAPRKVGMISGLVILVFLILITSWEIKGHRNDNWRALMITISSEQETGDRILCFPLHHCVMAADFYLPHAPPISGGLLVQGNDESVFLQPQDKRWCGYKTGYEGELDFLTDDALKNRMINGLNSAERLWFVAGDGTLGNYPEAGLVEEALTENWVPTKQWNFSPLILKLYVRKQL